MFNGENGGLSAADVAAVTRNNWGGGGYPMAYPMAYPVAFGAYGNGGYGNGGFLGGDGIASIIWIVVILAIFGGFGNGGWFGNGNNNALTRGELCQDMNFSDLSNAVGRLQQSVSEGFANQNTNFVDRVDNLSNQVASGFDAVNLAIVRDGYETRNAAQQNMIANMQNTNAIQSAIQNCCCNVQNGFSQVAFQQATDTCAIQTAIANAARDINDNTNAGIRSLYDFMVNDKISDLQAENQNLRLAASQANQNQYLVDQLRPTARPAYITCNPYTASYGFGLNNGNCNCGLG